MQNLMELKNVSPLGFYAQVRNYQESPKWFGMQLATGHKTKIETHIDEPSYFLDSWHSILAREPLTLGSNPSEVVVFIDFDN